MSDPIKAYIKALIESKSYAGSVSDEQLEDLQFADSVATLGPVMFASEIGFGRHEQGSFATLDVMTEWNQLTMVVADLSELIVQG